MIFAIILTSTASSPTTRRRICVASSKPTPTIYHATLKRLTAVEPRPPRLIAAQCMRVRDSRAGIRAGWLHEPGGTDGKGKTLGIRACASRLSR